MNQNNCFLAFLLALLFFTECRSCMQQDRIANALEKLVRLQTAKVPAQIGPAP